MSFKEITAESLMMNPFTKIGKEWMLITAEKEGKVNTMTASWGGVGIMWGKNTATVYLRPQRYTKEFVDAGEVFTISFYGEAYRKALGYCGKVSGREEPAKIENAGLTPCVIDGVPVFEEASMVFVCRKMYQQEMKPECFVDSEARERWYPQEDYHTMYIAEITAVYEK